MDVTPAHAAYLKTPEFEAYWKAYQGWLGVHQGFRDGLVTRLDLIAAQEEAGRLLAVCRELPEHKAAFGW